MDFKILIGVLLVFMLFLFGCSTGSETTPLEDTIQQETLQTGQGSTQTPLPDTQQPPIEPPSVIIEEELKPLNENAVLYKALVEAGIEDALVDFQEDKILIAFNLPSGLEEKNTAHFVLGTASTIAFPSQQLMVEVFSGDSSKVYSVSALKVQQFFNSEISEAQFESAVSVS